MIILDLVVLVLSMLMVFSLGAAIGSFLNVVVYRLPAGESLIHPPSRCPHCQHRLAAKDNIPVLGWLLLQGKCRYCQAAIAWRYPLVEMFTGFLFLVVFWQFDWSLQSASLWLLGSWLLALSLIDLDTLTLPSALTQSGLVVGFCASLLQAYIPSPSLSTLITAGLGAIAGAVVGLWLLDGVRIIGSLLFNKEAMGSADPKLAAMIGAWLGVSHLLLALFVACAVGAIVGSSVMALQRLDRQQPMPFGPFLALGAVTTALWGDRILNLYLQIFFPLV
jgi:leader peptidase (prepilin peptidase)/N-methyltransferase